MMRIFPLISILIALLLLSGCSRNDTTTNYEPTTLGLTLLNHEAILDVTAATLSPQFIDAMPEIVLHFGVEYRQLTVYRIRYISDTYEVMGYIVAPIDYMYKNYPILIYNRGGNRDFGALTPEQIAIYAMHGYIVMASQYRGVAGGTGREQFGGDEINDVLRLIDISESFHFAQQGGVYMFGSSRGGMMTYIASRMDNRIRAAAVWAAVSNVSEGFYEREWDMQRVYIELIGGTPSRLPEEFERRSAVMWADEIMVPLLIGHGGDLDWRVSTHHSINMAAALERYGKPHRLVIFPDADHSLYGTNFLEEMDRWFREHPIE